MKTIIAGTRSYNDYEEVKQIMLAFDDTTEVVSGCARGADTLGERWANENKIPVKRFPADWKTYGKRAGYIRNRQMGEYADNLIAFWDGQSKGTEHMINIMRELDKFICVVKYK